MVAKKSDKLVSDVVWQALIAAVVTISIGWMNHRTNVNVQEIGDAAAKRVEEVKTTLDKSTTSSEKKLDDIHEIVNSGSIVQLGLYATALRTIADMSKKPEHVANAEAAEKMHRDRVEEAKKALEKNAGKKAA